MDAGMVTAVGQFVSSREGQVDGNMAVTLQTSVSTVHAPVRVFGTLPDLSATTRK
jgi:acetamidase/formamidase